MLNHEFSSRTKHSQAWILSLIASWDAFEICSDLLLKYVGTPDRFKLYQNDVDTFFIAQFPEINMVGQDGTKNGRAWLSDAMAFGSRFSYGIFNDMKRAFVPEIKTIVNRFNYTMIAGQSKGGANALCCNFLLRECSFNNVESWGFANPPIATPLGCDILDAHGVCHTNFVTDPFSPSLPSDPTDDATAFNKRLYGTTHELWGGSSVFDHSYLNITKSLIYWFIQQYKNCNDQVQKEKYINDAIYWSGMIQPGNDLIKK